MLNINLQFVRFQVAATPYRAYYFPRQKIAMTNPVQAMRMLITYAVIIPLAILVGYLTTDPMDRGTLFFFAILAALVVSPIFIKWHYQILIFGLGCPAYCFFVPGNPPLGQVVVILSLGIAIVERTLSSERRFVSVPVMTWPLLFIAAMVYFTAQLTGGIGLHTMGGDVGGGRKYLSVFIGLATYFALTSRVISRDKWKFYLALSMLPAVAGVLSDMFPYLPGPFKYINLLFPPNNTVAADVEAGNTTMRLTNLSFALGIFPIYLLARYGLRGIFFEGHLWRIALFLAGFCTTMLGGYRNAIFGFGTTCTLIFFMEGLHRTRLLPALALAGALVIALLASFSDHLPYTYQRSLSFLPFKWQPEVVMDADASSEWRYKIWRATWPKVPEHLLLGKGYALTKEDYENIGQGQFANIGASHIDASEETLAISSDYHSGPLSTLMAFGVWGGLGIVWLMAATWYVVYQNYKYGDPAMRSFNIYTLATCSISIFSFFFLFGAFHDDVGSLARTAGFSIAMNGGLARRPAKPASNPVFRPRQPTPIPAPQTAKA
jgi:hypothetical protein